MALYLLNISVDTSDPNPEQVLEDLTFNDQESIIEIIVEQVFGFEDAIEEYDDHDTEETNNKNNFKKIDLAVHLISGYNTLHFTFEPSKLRIPDLDVRLTNGFSLLNIPPPKICFF